MEENVDTQQSQLDSTFTINASNSSQLNSTFLIHNSTQLNDENSTREPLSLERIVNNGNNRDSPLLGNDSLNEDTVLDLECSLPSPIRECNTTSPPRTPMADVTASTSNIPDNENSVEKRKSRKRGRDEKNWIKNIRQRKRQKGEEYTDRRGKVHHSRKPQPINCTRCRYRCSMNFSDNDRDRIISDFWDLSDSARDLFYNESTEKSSSNVRSRAGFQNKRKENTIYKLKIRNNWHQVCRDFYCKTLDVSKSRIETFHKNKVQDTGLPKSSTRPFNGKKYSEEVVNLVKNHIESFPKVDSHFCRANTERQYLDPELNLVKLYNLYYAREVEEGRQAVLKWKYDEVFNTQYNLDFHHPKKDRCDKCELHHRRVAAGAETEEENDIYTIHRTLREQTTAERHRDKEITDPNHLIVSFDLENIFALPKSDISSNFYKSKLTTYNMTGIVQQTKKVNCAVWPEHLAGRSGNDIASSVITILHQITSDHPSATDIVLWSDSCVPQNRNSNMSLALMLFLKENPQLRTITQKYCEPGHSNIQAIDTVHSIIERVIRLLEIHSPVSLVSYLSRIEPNNIKMSVTQMRKKHVMNYGENTKNYGFSNIKYTKIKSLQYHQADLSSISTQFYFDQPQQYIQIFKPHKSRSSSTFEVKLPVPKLLDKVHQLTKKKCDDITSMLPFMPARDKQYTESVISAQ